MAIGAPEAAPVLSTPDTHIFEDPTPAVDIHSLPKLSDEELHTQYEIARTVDEVRAGGWKRIALQFPDEMLVDAPRVFEALNDGFERAGKRRKLSAEKADSEKDRTVADLLDEGVQQLDLSPEDIREKVYILADTSYGACCVDEIAAEHVDADVVVHYGRSCLSPTARLPVIYVFTSRSLDLAAVQASFKAIYPERDKKIILMADIPYAHHIPHLHSTLQDSGYTNIFPTSIIHDPSSLLPNRTVPPILTTTPSALQSHTLFHISTPPTPLLLTLSSRLSSIHIYPTPSPTSSPVPSSSSSTPLTLPPLQTTPLLRRRYAVLLTLPSVAIIGILIATLSHRSYLPALQKIQNLISQAGKKYYTVVVGKINAAKLANFAEVGAWVVVGCWESGLVDMKGEEGFWRPMVTPFELEVALGGEAGRVWAGEWRGGFEGVGGLGEGHGKEEGEREGRGEEGEGENGERGDGDEDSEEESAPPEFDLRTGRYVAGTRPLGGATSRKKKLNSGNGRASTSLIKRANGDVARVGGEASPGAEFLRSKRTWQGLGSDFEISYQEDGAIVEEGRQGIARGYTVGDQSKQT
ncbi:MAG: Diphthamide biosynthesis protein 2 [Bogoriella megaspora]|nr:MAG: Diphthamide biosynthesis protein 2 [Bogoriella megaspora]